MAQIIDFTAALQQRRKEKQAQVLKDIISQVAPSYVFENDANAITEIEVYTLALDMEKVYLLLLETDPKNSPLYFMVMTHDGETVSDELHEMSLEEMKMFLKVCKAADDDRSVFTAEALEMTIKKLEKPAKKTRKKKEANTDVQ
ncbi:hypothetical protein D3C85_454870 [compost metagenome]